MDPHVLLELGLRAVQMFVDPGQVDGNQGQGFNGASSMPSQQPTHCGDHSRLTGSRALQVPCWTGMYGWAEQEHAQARNHLPNTASKALRDSYWSSMPSKNYGSRPEPFSRPMVWRGRREASPIPSDLGAGKRGFMLVSEATGRRWHALRSVRVCQFGEVRDARREPVRRRVFSCRVLEVPPIFLLLF